jgi:hypothetical protein
MKTRQQKPGMVEKKPQPASQPILSAGATQSVAGNAAAKPVFGSPSAAVWSKYIDSRMKQFGTR